MMARLAVVVALVAAVLGGCSAQDQRITRLDYLPSKPAAKLAGPAVGVSTPTESHGLPVNKLGEPIVGDVVKHNDNVSAHVLVTDSIPRWVGSAVTGELKAAGVNAGYGLEEKAGRTMVKTEVTKIKNETKVQWSSNAVTSTIGLEMRVERDGKLVGTVKAEGVGQVEAAAKLTEVMHQAMQMALHDAMKKGVPGVVELVREAEGGR